MSETSPNALPPSPSKEEQAFLVKALWESLQAPSWNSNDLIDLGKLLHGKKAIKDFPPQKFNLLFPYLTNIASHLGSKLLAASSETQTSAPTKEEQAFLIKILWKSLLIHDWRRSELEDMGKMIFGKRSLKDIASQDGAIFDRLFPILIKISNHLGSQLMQPAVVSSPNAPVPPAVISVPTPQPPAPPDVITTPQAPALAIDPPATPAESPPQTLDTTPDNTHSLTPESSKD